MIRRSDKTHKHFEHLVPIAISPEVCLVISQNKFKAVAAGQLAVVGQHPDTGGGYI